MYAIVPLNIGTLVFLYYASIPLHRFPYQIIWINIWEESWSDHVFALDVIRVLVDPGVEGETVPGLALVQHKVGGEQHEQAELVALAFEPAMS